MPTVIVDARNVLRSRWPNIAEDELARLCSVWADATDADVVAVFDGEAPALRSARCVVVGTGRESADDWLVRRAGALAEEGARFWLVTSDRALRAAAGTRAERVVGGGSFARELQR